MLKIVNKSTGEVIGYETEVRYVSYDANSGTSFQAYGAEDADGIAVRGELYNIGEEEKIPGAGFALIVEIEDGKFHTENREQAVENTDNIETMQGLIMDLDNTNSILQEALMELDNQVNGGE